MQMIFCLMAPSPSGLQKLVDICVRFGLDNDIIYNTNTSMCMVLNCFYFALIAHHHTVHIFGLILIRPHLINFVLPTNMSIGVSWANLAEIVPAICVLQMG